MANYQHAGPIKGECYGVRPSSPGLSRFGDSEEEPTDPPPPEPAPAPEPEPKKEN